MTVNVARILSDTRSTLGGALAVGLVTGSTVLAGGGGGGDGGAGSMDGPDTLQLHGVVRDLKENTAEGGHPDFERRPDSGFGQYCGNVSPYLGADSKPVFIGEGWKVDTQWQDSAGRPICYTLFDESRGDTPGTRGVSSTGGIQSLDSFYMWFNDVPGVNISRDLTLNFVRDQSSGKYVFDDKENPLYEALDGFFPIEDALFGNPGGSPDRNFHFTFELHTNFVYKSSESQVFRFIGDDDVWVFIDGRLVIDLGGVHSAREQYVDITRLGLVDGEEYSLDFFFAERHRTQSNFRIETNLLLQSRDIPATTAAYD